jgi:IclR family mhp operon transcriptional activator
MVQPLRTLSRGLEVLRVLNRNNGAGLRVLASATELSRGAVHRLLETMVSEGYVRKIDGHYFVERKLRTLTAGLEESDWVNQAQAVIEDLCRDVMWPISIVRPNGLGMQTCAGTDRMTPLRHHVVPLGLKVPMLASAGGRVYVAFQPDNVRSMMIEVLARQAEFPQDRELCNNVQSVAEMLDSVRLKGVASAKGKNRTTIVAVPIVKDDSEVLGALCLRYFTASLSIGEVMRRHLSKMQASAHRIAEASSESLLH